MANWKTNPIMEWAGDKVTDHGRSSLNMSTERVGSDKRMVDGTLRRHHVTNKRTWSCSWAMIPSRNDVAGKIETADGHMSGEDIEDFYNTTPGEFLLVLRRGSAIDVTTPLFVGETFPYEDDDFYAAYVMITDFSKEVVKRGGVDLWNIDVTLQEV